MSSVNLDDGILRWAGPHEFGQFSEELYAIGGRNHVQQATWGRIHVPKGVSSTARNEDNLPRLRRHDLLVQPDVVTAAQHNEGFIVTSMDVVADRRLPRLVCSIDQRKPRLLWSMRVDPQSTAPRSPQRHSRLIALSDDKGLG